MALSRIEIITGMDKKEGLIARLSHPGFRERLQGVGVTGITVFEVLGCGVERGTQEYQEEENKVMQLLPKCCIMIVCESKMVDQLIQIIMEEIYTGHIGDGKIFVSDVTNAIRVRTGEEGTAALTKSEVD